MHLYCRAVSLTAARLRSDCLPAPSCKVLRTFPQAGLDQTAHLAPSTVELLQHALELRPVAFQPVRRQLTQDLIEYLFRGRLDALQPWREVLPTPHLGVHRRPEIQALHR